MIRGCRVEVIFRDFFFSLNAVFWNELVTLFYPKDLLVCVNSLVGVKFRPLNFSFFLNSCSFLYRLLYFTGRAMPVFLCLKKKVAFPTF